MCLHSLVEVKNYIMQPRHCLEKVIHQNCLCEQGDVKKEKAKDHLK